MRLKWWLYRKVMRLAHRHGWHHVKTLHIEGGDVQQWCQWCGLRETKKRVYFEGLKLTAEPTSRRDAISIGPKQA